MLERADFTMRRGHVARNMPPEWRLSNAIQLVQNRLIIKVSIIRKTLATNTTLHHEEKFARRR